MIYIDEQVCKENHEEGQTRDSWLQVPFLMQSLQTVIIASFVGHLCLYVGSGRISRHPSLVNSLREQVRVVIIVLIDKVGRALIEN